MHLIDLVLGSSLHRDVINQLPSSPRRFMSFLQFFLYNISDELIEPVVLPDVVICLRVHALAYGSHGIAHLDARHVTGLALACSRRVHVELLSAVQFFIRLRHKISFTVASLVIFLRQGQRPVILNLLLRSLDILLVDLLA